MRGQAEKPLKRFPSHWFLCTQLKLGVNEKTGSVYANQNQGRGKSMQNQPVEEFYHAPLMT